MRDLVFAILLVFFSSSLAQVLYFNPKMESKCVELPPSCFFNDTAMWIPVELPNNMTDLVVNSSSPIQLVMAQPTFTLASLVVTGNATVIVSGSVLNVQITLALYDNSTLKIIGSGAVDSVNNFYQNDSSTLFLQDQSQIIVQNTYFGSSQANIVVLGGNAILVYEYWDPTPTQVASIFVETGLLAFSGSANNVYIGEYGYLTGSIIINELGYLYGGADTIIAGNKSIVYINSTAYINEILNIQEATVYWDTASINVPLSMYNGSFLYITALEGPGNFSIFCGEFGTTIVENALGNNQQTVLLCGNDNTWDDYSGELILYGNFIIYANEYFPGNIKLDGSLTYVSQSLTIRHTSKIPNNSSIVIPSGGLLSFENSYYMWPNLPWPMTWQPYGAIGLFMSSVDFGSALTLDEGRQIIFLPMDTDDLMSVIEADYILVSNTSKLWFQYGALADVIGSVACEGTLDLTSPSYFSDDLNGLITNVTINGNLTLYNSSTVLIPQTMAYWSGDPWGIGFISVQDSLYLAGTLNVSIGGNDYVYNKVIDFPIIQAGKIYGDFQTFIPTILLTDFNYTLTYSIEENVVVLHLQQHSP